MLPDRPSFANGALLALRLVIGFGFMAHGWAKLMRGPDKFAVFLQWIGVPFPGPMAWLVTFVELAGGLAMLLGAFVMLVSIPLIIIHLVAILGVQWRYGFSSVSTIGVSPITGPQFGPPGYEVNLLYIAGILVLVAMRAGSWSVDGLVRAKRSPAS